MNFIGLNIKHLCKLKKISQAEFGELFGLKNSTISTYVQEKCNPQVETIQKICAYFEITIDEFMNTYLKENEKYKIRIKIKNSKDKAISTVSKKNVYIGNSNNNNSNSNNLGGVPNANEADALQFKVKFLEMENTSLRREVELLLELIEQYKNK